MHTQDCTITADDAMWPSMSLDRSMDSASSVFSDTASQGKEYKGNGSDEEGERERVKVLSGVLSGLPRALCVSTRVYRISAYVLSVLSD